MISRGRVLVVAAVVSLLAAACWPVPGGGPDRQNHNASETIITTGTVADLEQIWSADIGEVASEPVLSGGRVFVHTGDALLALDAATGDEIWSVGIDEFLAPQFVGPVHVHRGAVAVATGYNRGHSALTFRFDPATGEVEEGLMTGHLSGVRGPHGAFLQTLDDPRIGTYTFLYLVDLDDGSSRNGVVGGLSSPELTVGHDLVFHVGFGLLSEDDLNDSGNGVRAFPVRDARTDCFSVLVCPEWATELPGTTTFPAVTNLDGDVVYAVPQGGGLYALDSATGEVLWSSGPEIGGVGSPALADSDGLLYVPGAGGFTYVFDAEGCDAGTCAPLWRTSAGEHYEQLGGQPTVAGTGESAVLFTRSSVAGVVHAYPAAGCGVDDCSPVWAGTVSGSLLTTPVVVSGGRVFVGTDDGLVAFGLP
jgi:outer membrane protein assembly factor BamB